MIKTELIHTCHFCGSCQIEKNGQDYNGQQKFHCLSCGRYGTLNPKQRYREAEKETILQAYPERMSMRGIQRVFGVAYQTLKGWLLEQDQKNPAMRVAAVCGNTFPKFTNDATVIVTFGSLRTDDECSDPSIRGQRNRRDRSRRTLEQHPETAISSLCPKDLIFL